ncbi:hypothetical protein V8F20_007502 [Naviculisporaceae sp. PSN 640]
MISSAPVVQSSLSSSQVLDLCLADVVNVEFKDVKPVVMNVNGEAIVLENRFTFDITPVNLSDSSSADSSIGSIGQLKRVRNFSQLRPKKSLKRPNLLPELPDDLKALLCQDLDRIPEELSSSPARDAKPSTGGVVGIKAEENPLHKNKQATASKPPLITENPPQHKCSKLTEDEKVRFQGLLSRLNKKEEPAVGKPAISIFDVRSSDPAILAAKVKEDTVTIRSLRSNESRREVLESVHRPQATRLQTSENSRDSGYGTGPSSQSEANNSASIHGPTAGFLPSHQDGTKKLNPAAAEFKFSGETADMPFLIPKRLSRPPLTGSLFEAPSERPAQQITTPVRPPPGFAPVLRDITTTQTVPPLQPELAPHGNAQPEHMTGPALAQPGPLGMLDPRASEVAPVPAPINAFNPFAAPGPQISLPNVNPFGTFPPPDVALPFVPPPPGFTRNTTLPGPLRPALPILGERQQPLFGPAGKKAQPPFPVIEKPRDHDPVKQQQYEAYLEWRKANEPGYHIECKMRQAKRIVRQYQMKQAAEQKGVRKTEEKTENPHWKSIVEKAKAVVANAAAVAAAEKRSRGESVREEFKAKIQESCSDLRNHSQQGSSEQSSKVQNVDEKKDEKREALPVDDKQERPDREEKIKEEST